MPYDDATSDYLAFTETLNLSLIHLLAAVIQETATVES